MRLILLNLVFILLSCNVSAQDTITKYYKNWTVTSNKNLATSYRKAFRDSNKLWITHQYSMNNKIQMIGSFKTKKFDNQHGHFIYFYENGNKKSEGECINNMNDGLWTYFYENGQKKAEGKFRNDLRQEKWVYWYGNGQKQSQGWFINNLTEDKWEYWFDTGEKESEGKFINNKKVGIWNYFYRTGPLETIEKFENGKLMSLTSYFENGKIKFEVNCENGIANGEWKYWNIDNFLYLKGNMSDNLKVGEWIRFFPNGENLTLYYENGVLVNKKLGGIIKKE